MGRAVEKDLKGFTAETPMEMRILSWNVRGANDRNKRKVIKALIKSRGRAWFVLRRQKFKLLVWGLFIVLV